MLGDLPDYYRWLRDEVDLRFAAWALRSAAPYFLKIMLGGQAVFRADEVAMLQEIESQNKDVDERNAMTLVYFQRAKAAGDREAMRRCRGAMAYGMVSSYYEDRPEKFRIEV